MLPELKSREDYVDDYLDKYNELNARDALWRLRMQPQEFLHELDRILERSRRDRAEGSKNEYAIRRDELACISVLLMDKLTFEEACGYRDRLREQRALLMAAEAPAFRQAVARWAPPLKQGQLRKLYTALFYQQITPEDIPEPVWQEFKQSRAYEAWVKNSQRQDGNGGGV